MIRSEGTEALLRAVGAPSWKCQRPWMGPGQPELLNWAQSWLLPGSPSSVPSAHRETFTSAK